MMENQLTILAESLEQKIQVLKKIQEYNRLQEQTFTNGEAKLQSFDSAVEEKGRLIEELKRLDEGFELLYERLARQLEGNREKYAPQIRGIQQLITQVTELSVSIQAQEVRNKQLIEQFFAKERAGLRQNRKSSKAAYDYYKGMNNTAFPQSRYYDNKK